MMASLVTANPKRSASIALALALLTVGFTAPAPSSAAREVWTKVVTPNFVVVSDSPSGEAGKAALMLEQFRHTASLLFPDSKVKAPLPTRVYLFRSHGSFHPFKPKQNGKTRGDVNGYFFDEGDRSFIALTTGGGGAQAYEVIFHEYQHFIVSNNLPDAPLWLDEGLAEFYSAFEPRYEGREVLLGRASARHVLALRKSRPMPLQRLFAVNHGSPEYSKAGNTALFYAQSWAVVHYLMLGNGRRRQPQFARFIRLLGNGKNVEENFREAFQADYRTLEKELEEYTASEMFPATVYSIPEGFDPSKETRVETLSEAEVEFYLGDLLLSARRTGEAEPRLQRAVERDARCAECQSAMGALRIRQYRFAEALKFLESGLSLGPRNYRAHHLFANALREEERYGEAIEAYNRALQLNPGLASVHLDLSLAYLGAGQRQKSDEAFERASKLKPQGDWHYLTRSFAALRMGLGRQAAADSLAYLTRRGWSDDSAPYAALTAYFGYRKDKREDEAAKLIEEMSSKLDANAWPYPVIKYLDRQMTAQQLISSARGRDELTEARAYAGMDLSLGGNRDEAVVHLRWVKEKGEQGPGQYAMALGELRRLESDVGGKAR